MRPSLRRGSTAEPMWRFFRWLRGDRAPFHARARELGLPSLALDQLLLHAHLRDAWNAIPRGDWALELLVRAEVAPVALAPVFAELVELGGLWHARADMPSVERAIEAHREGTLGVDAFLEVLLPAYASIVDAEPSVTAARLVTREQRVRSRELYQAELDALDLRHLAAQADLAARIRARAPFDELAARLGETSAHPYR